VTRDVDQPLADELASRNGRLRVAEDADPRELLEGLLGLPGVGVGVTRVAMFGQGAGASIDIHLSNGETMVFQSIREMVRPQLLVAELVACSGATPELKQPQAVRIVKLARLLAERAHVDREDADSRDWGIEFLQQTEKVDFTLYDQVERWWAFELLSRRDPWGHAREHGGSFASACIVLRDVGGARLVRAEWFLRFVRSMVPRETPASLRVRMERVGWQRRGSEGRIKATAPARAATLQWAFWIVPADWEEGLA